MEGLLDGVIVLGRPRPHSDWAAPASRPLCFGDVVVFVVVALTERIMNPRDRRAPTAPAVLLSDGRACVASRPQVPAESSSRLGALIVAAAPDRAHSFKKVSRVLFPSALRDCDLLA